MIDQSSDSAKIISIPKCCSKKEELFISVIIPAYNREEYLGLCLDSLFKQSFPLLKYEVIVIDDNSTDNSKKLLENYSKKYVNLNVINNSDKNGSDHARALGIKNANADIIVFTDSDCILPSDWLSKIAKKFENRNVLCVQGTQKCEGKWGKFMHEGEKSLHILKKKRALDTKNLAIRKNLIFKHSFNKTISNTGDYELGQRLSRNIKIHYDPNITVTHIFNNFSSSLERGKRWGKAAAYIYEKYGEERINKRLKLPLCLLFFYYLGGLFYFLYKYKSFRGGIMFFVTTFLTAFYFKKTRARIAQQHTT
jgi:glycosyltransferase involved in cell wall biosynthesis